MKKKENVKDTGHIENISLNNWIQIIQWVTQNLNRLHIPVKDNDVK